MVNLTQIAVRGVAWVFGLSLIAAMLGYGVRIVLARGLSIEDFGLFYSVFTFLSLITIFNTLGFDKAFARFVPKAVSRKDPGQAKSVLVYGFVAIALTNILVVLIVFLLSNLLASGYFKAEGAGQILRLLAIAFFFDSFMQAVKYTLQGYKRVVSFALIDVVRMSLIILIAGVGLWKGYGLDAPVFAYLVTPVLLLVLFGTYFFSSVLSEEGRIRWNPELFKEVSFYSLFTLSAGVGMVILGYTDILALTYFSSLQQVGLYSAALPTARILIYLPLAAGSVLLPLAAELWALGKMGQLRDGIFLLYKYSMMVTVPLSLLVFSFADIILRVLYGESFIQGASILKVLSVGFIFGSLYIINTSIFAGIGKQKTASIVVYSGGFLNLAGNIILIPILGPIGAAYMTAATYILMAFLSVLACKRYVGFKTPLTSWSLSLIAGIFMITGIAWLKGVVDLSLWTEISLVASFGIVLYTGLLFVFGGIQLQEMKTILSRIWR